MAVLQLAIKPQPPSRSSEDNLAQAARSNVDDLRDLERFFAEIAKSGKPSGSTPWEDIEPVAGTGEDSLKEILRRASPKTLVRWSYYGTEIQARDTAERLADTLGWEPDDIATYLGAQFVGGVQASNEYERKLAALRALFQQVLEVVENQPELAREWLSTPIGALDGASPKTVILGGEISRIQSLLAEIESGLAA